MKIRKPIAIFAITSLSTALLLTGCGTPQGPADIVTITYDQVGACNGYEQDTGTGGAGPLHTVNAGPNAAFVAFRIVSFDNSKSTKDFNFDPNKLYINASPRDYMNSSLSLSHDLGVFTAVATTIPKGTTQGNNGITVTTVSTGTANGAVEANKTSFFLLYDTPAGAPGVVLVKRNPDQTTWLETDNCRSIKF